VTSSKTPAAWSLPTSPPSMTQGDSIPVSPPSSATILTPPTATGGPREPARDEVQSGGCDRLHPCERKCGGFA
jgi:hypothetical protein